MCSFLFASSLLSFYLCMSVGLNPCFTFSFVINEWTYINVCTRKTYCRSTSLFMKCYMLQEPCMNRVGLTTETNSSPITGAPSPVVGSLITRALFCPMPDNMTSARYYSTVYGYALQLFRYNKTQMFLTICTWQVYV